MITTLEIGTVVVPSESLESADDRNATQCTWKRRDRKNEYEDQRS